MLEGLKKGYEEEFSADTTFHVEYSLLSGEVIEEEVMTLPVRNLLAVLMFLGVFLGIYDYRKGEENGTFRTMSPSMTRMVAGMYLCIPILLLGVDTFFSGTVGSWSLYGGIMDCGMCWTSSHSSFYYGIIHTSYGSFRLSYFMSRIRGFILLYQGSWAGTKIPAPNLVYSWVIREPGI